MKTETQNPEEQINPFEIRTDEEKLREIIKKFSRQTKTYPPMEWWEFAG